MIQRKYESLAALYLAMDGAASALAILAAYWLRFAVEVIPVTKGQQDFGVYARILPLIVVVFPLAFAVQGLYRIRPTRAPAEEWLGVTVGTVSGALGLSGLLLWIRPEGILVDYSRATLGIFMACEIALVMLGRTAVRRALQARYRKGKNLERVLIAGGGELAKAVVARIRNHQELGFTIVGAVSDDEDIEGLPRLGSLAEAESVVAKSGIDHVFVALPHESAKQTMDLLDRLTRECVAIHVVPDLLQFMALRSRVEDVDGLPTINLSETPLDGWSLAVKRLFDVAVAGLALTLASPLMLLIAIVISDRGPRAGVLPAETDGARRSRVRDPEVPLDVGGCGVDRRPMGRKGRSPADPLGALDPRLVPRRAPAALERAPGRHEPGRAAPGAPRVRRALPLRISRTTCSATRCAPASPAGRRSTAGEGTRPCA